MTNNLSAHNSQRSLRHRVEGLLAYAGLAYALGFLTILFHTARYGIQVIEVIKPLNFWVGAPPTLVLLVSLSVLARKTPLSEQLTQDRPTTEKGQDIAVGSFRRAWRDFLETLGMMLFFFFPGLGVLAGMAVSDFVKARVPGGKLLAPLIIPLVMFAFIAASYTLMPALVGTLRGRLRRVASVFLGLFLAGAILWGYVVRVYPAIPQKYGGGKPSRVRLVVDSAQVPVGTLGWRSSPPRTGETATITGELELLYTSSNAYIVRTSGRPGSVVSVAQEAVKAVVWIQEQ